MYTIVSAQVTNPPIDAIREELVTSVEVMPGTKGNLLQSKLQDANKIRLKRPVLLILDVERLRYLHTNDWKAATIPVLFPAKHQEGGMEKALQALLQLVEKEVEKGVNLLILSDRKNNLDHATIPSILAAYSVHHHLRHEQTKHSPLKI